MTPRKGIVTAVLLATGFMSSSARAFYEGHAQTFYFGAQGGPNFLSHDNVLGSLQFDMGYTVAADMGYQFARHFRTDVSVGYTQNNIEHAANGIGQSHFLLNGYYDLPTRNLIFYMGGGLGYAHVSSDFVVNEVGHSYDQSGFAWKLASGIEYRVSDNFDFDVGLGYRLLATCVSDKDKLSGTIWNSSVLVTFSYHFKDI